MRVSVQLVRNALVPTAHHDELFNIEATTRDIKKCFLVDVDVQQLCDEVTKATSANVVLIAVVFLAHDTLRLCFQLALHSGKRT